MSGLYKRRGPATDRQYQALLNRKPGHEEVWDLLERLWDVFEPFADDDFPSKFFEQALPRFWEMYLAVTLHRAGFCLKPRSKEKPDICIGGLVDRPIWIEAVAPTYGDDGTCDQVPDPISDLGSNAMRPVPERQILLRVASVLRDKHCQYLKRLEKGIVSDRDPYIVAVNTWRATRYRPDRSSYPYLLKTVYAIGPRQLDFSTVDNSVSASLQYRPEIQKTAGAPVETDLFLTDGLAGFSATISMHCDPYRNPDTRGKPNGHGLVLAHNPKASNPLPVGRLRIGSEYRQFDEGGGRYRIDRT